jgi:hypothetical protein
MVRFHRTTAPRVREGRVQPKNNWRRTPDCDQTTLSAPVIDRRRPGRGYRHLLLKRDVERFIGLLPDWPELSRGLNVVALAAGRFNCDGWYRPGIVAVCAWPCELSQATDVRWYADHCHFLDRIGVPVERTPEHEIVCKFNEATARAYQLLHVLLHEFGHHHDLMTTRSQKGCARGEQFADQYAYRHEAIIWDRYLREFELY